MDNRRIVLLMVFSFSIIMLWDAWQRQHAPKPPVVTSQSAPATQTETVSSVPTPSIKPRQDAIPKVAEQSKPVSARRIAVKTDLYNVEISSFGGDIVRLELRQHPDSEDKTKRFVLFDDGGKHLYFAQSGLIGEGLPNHKMEWSLPSGDLVLKDGENKLELTLEAKAASGAVIRKIYVFQRGSYLVGLRHEGLPKNASAYYQITRDGKPAEAEASSMMMGVSTFTGPAVFTEEVKYQKVEFAEIAKGKAKFAQKADNGWLALIQHYFVTAWLAPAGVPREFYMRSLSDEMYSAGVIVPASSDGKSEIGLYAGPQEQGKLEAIAPGLDLVVDYGWLTVIAAPLFWVLAMLHKLLGNWGWAIIGLTVLLKLAFFPLSAASYKSMAKMKVLSPKLLKLKEMYGDDKARMNQEMMELYKREKVNPLGGCLPVLVQIPVFIALYWVLLGAVEMRNAPWLGWITDLSVKDPYYILPLVMGVTMVIQTKLNPAPPDPIQAKVMMMMPILFTFMFLFFPAGLVLYWTVNNILSIAQQWQITRMIEAGQGK